MQEGGKSTTSSTHTPSESSIGRVKLQRGAQADRHRPHSLCALYLCTFLLLFIKMGEKKHSRRRTTSYQYFGPAVSRKPRTGGRAIGAATARSCIHFLSIINMMCIFF